METSRRSEEARKQTGDMGDKGEKSVNQKSKKEREQNSKTRKGPMRGPDFSSRGRSSHGQADQLPESSPHSQQVPTLLPGCPRGRSAPHRGWRRRSPRGDLGGCQLNLLLPKWKQSQKRQQERMNLQIQKGKREQRENRWKWPPKRLKIYLHQMERLKTRGAQALMEQERKKLRVIKITHPSLSVVPVYLLVQYKGIFLSIILQMQSFLAALVVFLRR